MNNYYKYIIKILLLLSLLLLIIGIINKATFIIYNNIIYYNYALNFFHLLFEVYLFLEHFFDLEI